MSSIIVAGFTLGITILAFALKNGMLYAACIIFWIVTGFILYNLTWPAGNTFYAYAAILVCLAMTIVMVAATIMRYLEWSKGRQPHVPTDEETQAAYRRQVYKATHRKGPWET